MTDMKYMNAMATTAALLVASALTGCAGNAYGPGPYQPGYANPIRNPPYLEDEATAARIRNVLASDPRVGAETLTVKVVNGAVELSGSPKDLRARDLALQLTQRTHGVRSVFNNMVMN